MGENTGKCLLDAAISHEGRCSNSRQNTRGVGRIRKLGVRMVSYINTSRGFGGMHLQAFVKTIAHSSLEAGGSFEPIKASSTSCLHPWIQTITEIRITGYYPFSTFTFIWYSARLSHPLFTYTNKSARILNIYHNFKSRDL